MFTLRPRLDAGERLLGMMMFSASDTLVEIAGFAGFDFAMLDLEHSMQSGSRRFVELARAAHGAGLAFLARVPSLDETIIRGVMETGAEGIVVPHVRSRSDAERAVRAVRFPPHGDRGFAAPSVRATGYGLRTGAEAFREATEQKAIVLLMAEDESFFENLDDILDTDGVSGVFFGTSDYAVSCGWRLDDPATQERCRQASAALTAAARARGLISMGISRKTDRAHLAAAVAAGHRMILAGSDVGSFSEVCRTAVSIMKSLESEPGHPADAARTGTGQ